MPEEELRSRFPDKAKIHVDHEAAEAAAKRGLLDG